MRKTKLQQEIERREFANSRAPFPIYDTEIIDDFKLREQMKSKADYDQEPVHYCKTCASIALKTVTIPSEDKGNTEIVYCKKCGNTDIGEAKNIHEWDLIYQETHGEKFLTENPED